MRSVRNLWILALILLLSLPTLAQENPAASVELPQLYITRDGQTRFNFPADWDAKASTGDDTSAFVSTSAAGLEISFGDQAVEGEVNILAGTATLDLFNERMSLSLDEEVSILELMGALVENNDDDNPEIFGDVELVTIADLPIAEVRFKLEDSFSGLAWLRQIEPSVYAITQFTTTANDMPDWEATALAVFLSITYVPGLPVPELTEEKSSLNGQITVPYPAGWESDYESSDETTVMVVNQTAAFAHTLGSQIQPGQVNILIGGYSQEQMQDILETEGEDLLADIGALLVEGVQTFSSNDGWTIEAPVELTFDDYPAIVVRVVGETFVASTWVFEREPGVFISMNLLTHPDEEADWLPTAIAIARQTPFTPAG
jgi:hypothetical protein